MAIIYTRDELNSVRPEAEQFIKLHQTGIEIDVICHKDSFYENEFKRNNMSVVGDYPINKKDKKATQHIRKLLTQNAYDILHVLHRPAIVCGIKAAKGLSVKVIVYRGASGLYWHDPTAYENALHPRVDKVICVCDDVKKNLQKQLFFKKDKAMRIYKGHDLSWYKGVKPFDLGFTEEKKDPFIVTCVANNRKWKGVSDVLKAVQQLPQSTNLKVLLVGRGLDEAFYNKQIKSLKNGDKVKALGFRSDVLNILAASDVVLQYSYKNEGLSRSTIEGMCLGAVPVVSDAGGNAELVEHEKTGLVVPAKSPNDLCKALSQLHEKQSICKELSEAARKSIREDFSLENTVKETRNLYEEMLGK